MVNEMETRVTRLEVWKNGNGAKGAELGIRELEERVRPENCLGVQAISQYINELKEQQEQRRTFRIGDVANIIQLVLLAIVVYQLFT